MIPDQRTVGQPETEIGSWFRRSGRLLALWRNDQYRRDVYAIFLRNLRRLVDWRFLCAAVLLAILGVWAFVFHVQSPHDAYEALLVVFALAALAAGATIYASEREHGTLELVWLATGSEKALLRLKVFTHLMALVVFMVPTVILAGGQVDALPPAPLLLFFLTVNSLFILALMAYLGTWLPQAWAAGLLGVVLLGGLYYSLQGSTLFLNPFLNPIPAGSQSIDNSRMIVNRIVFLIVSAILLRLTAARLRRAF